MAAIAIARTDLTAAELRFGVREGARRAFSAPDAGVGAGPGGG